jgi:hypothetical protein
MKRIILNSPEYIVGYTNGYKEGYNKVLENYLDQIYITKPAPSIIIECRKEKCDFYKKKNKKPWWKFWS